MGNRYYHSRKPPDVRLNLARPLTTDSLLMYFADSATQIPRHGVLRGWFGVFLFSPYFKFGLGRIMDKYLPWDQKCLPTVSYHVAPSTHIGNSGYDLFSLPGTG